MLSFTSICTFVHYFRNISNLVYTQSLIRFAVLSGLIHG